MKTTITLDTPFNFKYTLDYFSRSDKELVDLSRENLYYRVLDIKSKPVLAIVKSVGPVSKPSLEINVPGCRSARTMKEAERIIKRIFSTAKDIRTFYLKVSGDEALSRLSKANYGLKPPVTPSLYEALVWAITGQQMNLSFIYSLKARLVMKYGPKCHYNGRRFYGFPSCHDLSSATYNELRGMQYSGRKAEYIKGLTKMMVNENIDVDELNQMEDEQAIEKLMKIKGVGRWTAEYALLRGMGRWSVIPADDIGIRNAVTLFYKYKKQVSAKEVRKRAREWGEYKGCAGFYLLFAYQRHKNKGTAR
jgi:DNA-3-methyladenine glycosylase II